MRVACVVVSIVRDLRRIPFRLNGFYASRNRGGDVILAKLPKKYRGADYFFAVLLYNGAIM